jgi:cytochrome c-type biogenesis protein CcmF
VTAPFGELTLWLALVVALGGVACGALGLARGGSVWGRRTRAALVVGAALATLAMVLLGAALARGDMRLAYVADHTERSLPIAYKLSALWAGQEGSLLLWAWMVSVAAAGAGLARRRRPGGAEAVTLGVMAGLNAFFAAVLLVAANPFALAPEGGTLAGRGLNPMLQHWAMVLHPPTLFLGYALSAVPFAAMVGALVSGEGAGRWSGSVRRWALGSWLFLTAGIALGAWWAYVELGWGGYWAWDPVENASLLPWLTGTALLHTLAVDRQRGQFRVWTASLSALTFVLCFVATYITRSGVIESVHAFGASSVGSFFFWAIAVAVGGSTGLIVWRARAMRSHTRVEGLLSRDGMILAGNVLLVVMAGVVLLGTLSPVISGLVGAEPLAVRASFYNQIVGPLGLALAALMSLGPVLVYGREAGESIRRSIARPGAVTLAMLLGAVAMGVRSVAALAVLAIAAMTVMLIAAAFVRSLRAAGRARGAGLLGALRLMDNDHRRYGGQLVHLGMVLVLVGVAGSSLYAERMNLSLRRGEAVWVGRYEARLEALTDVRGANYSGVEAKVLVTDAGGRRFELRPQRRFYDMSVESAAEVAIRSGLREDVYIALLGWDAGGGAAAIQVLVNPLTAWIWIGAGVMFGGGVFCMLPRLAAQHRNVSAAAEARGRGERGARPRVRGMPAEPVHSA